MSATRTQPAALVRGDDGNFHVRHFATPADATAASLDRELRVPPADEIRMVMGRKGGALSPREFADRIGVSARTVRRAYADGGLPGAKEHGPKLLKIPASTLRLAEAYGLRQLVRMTKAGLV